MKKTLLTIAFLSSLYSCKKEVIPTPDQIETPTVDKIAPEDFRFSTTKEINVDIKLVSNANAPLKGILVEIKSPSTEDVLFKALTDENGQIKAPITVSADLETLIVAPKDGIAEGTIISLSQYALSSTIKSENSNNTDSDNDGVPDKSDEFPNDPDKAYISYYPSKNNWGTLGFEDNWPNTGDYDLNDLVVSYRYAFISNAQNKVIEITGDFAAIAVGASFQNGFGVEFPFSSSMVSRVTGQKFMSSYIKLATNGVEEGQTKAVIIPFDNSEALISNFAGAYFVNTKMDMPKVSGDTAHVNIKLTAPITLETLGNAPFNPFLISNLRRGYEVHLPGGSPTNNADKRLFGTADDDSNTSGKTYLSKANWPWALNFTEPFAYPIEQSPINQAYTRFLDWAASGGEKFKDWHKNHGLGFRNPEFIYSK